MYGRYSYHPNQHQNQQCKNPAGGLRPLACTAKRGRGKAILQAPSEAETKMQEVLFTGPQPQRAKEERRGKTRKKVLEYILIRLMDNGREKA